MAVSQCLWTALPMNVNREIHENHDQRIQSIHSFIHIRLLIITMTERIMYSERHAEYIKQENEQQMIGLLVMNVNNEITIIKFSEFRNELSIMESRP